MDNNGRKPAHPLGEYWQKEIGHGVHPDEYKGLTKREYFAGLAMQGLCANSIPGSHHRPHELITEAIEYADELLKQLVKE